MAERRQTDVLVIGGGAAGLSAALPLAQFAQVTVICKGGVEGGSTNWAQGGLAAVTDPADSVEAHVRDTLIAGDGLCNEAAVRFTIDAGKSVVQRLVDWGVRFDRDQPAPGNAREGAQAQAGDEAYHLTREGGHSFRRVLHVADSTGRAIAESLWEQAAEHPNIQIENNRVAVDLITTDRLGMHPNRCVGAYVYNDDTHEVDVIQARCVVLATGGASKVYLFTSNPDGATGDGIAMAWRAGASVANMEFNQFHPTCLFHPHAKSFLISEAVRGEGGILRLPNGERFMERFDERLELAPRDVVARAIDHEMKRLGADCLYLDITHARKGLVEHHFPTIYSRCLDFGIDMTKEPIPVVPAAHYTCGGVVVDLNGATDIPGLYAAGETTCTGLHGANRLASNSLLECLVFGEAAARHIEQNYAALELPPDPPMWDASQVTDSDENVVLSHNWDELRRFMWDYVGIVRTHKRLERARHRVDLLKHEVQDYYSNYQVGPDLLELRNLLQVADLIVASAMQRKESRGLHYTLDYPDKLETVTDTLLRP